MICRLKYFLFILFFFQLCVINAQDGGQRAKNIRKNRIAHTKLSVSPVFGFFKANKNHAGKATQKMAFCFSVKEEFRIDKKNKSFIAIGLDYMFYGTKFDSYYFPSDSVKLYRNFNATYNLNAQELDIPILIKRSFQRENNSIFSGYVFAGYSYRILVQSKLSVSYYGDEAAYDNGNLQFKIPAFTKTSSSFLLAGAGFQKNNPNKHKAFYAEIQLKYGLSPLYIKQPYAPSSLFISSHFINLTVGVKI